jgi:hypothetical protein
MDEHEICGRCNGSGEGMHDGTKCMVCNDSRQESDTDSPECERAMWEMDCAKDDVGWE